MALQRSKSKRASESIVAGCVGTILWAASAFNCSASTYSGAYLTGVVRATVASVQAATQQTVQLQPEGQPLFPETDQERAERQKLPIFDRSGRVSVKTPGGDVPLGNWLTIPVTFAPGKLVSLHVSQTAPGRNALPQELLPVKVTLDRGLPSAIQIIPTQLGSLAVDLSAVYSDNGIANQTLHLNVVPSAQGLKQFSLLQGGHHITLVLEDAEQDRQISLNPTLQYEALGLQIFLDEATQIKLSVEQDKANPVIRLDKDGLIHALSEGTAIILGSFDGAIDKVTVHVYSKQNAPAGYRSVPGP